MTDTLRRTEVLQPGPAQALGGLLGVAAPDVADGAPLPLLWHWIYLMERPAQVDLGPDGHPLRGTLPAPPAPGMRRMWAGGRVHAVGSLRCGQEATRVSRVSSTQVKEGRSGRLTFITMEHEISQNGEIVISEHQNLVYRPTSNEPAAPSPEPTDGPVVKAAADEWDIEVSPTLLFRFSALTYNAHRIHYDRDYARTAEGYPGLLVHGPLQAIAMAEHARALGHTGRHFEYRLLAPLFDHQGMVVTGVRKDDEVGTQVRDLSGRPTATGTLTS